MTALFTSFGRIISDATVSIPGAGLGLHLSRELAAMAMFPRVYHWGTVILPRTAFGLPDDPAVMGRLARPVHAAPDEHRGAATSGLHILMVEDDVAVASMYALRLRRDGHDVTTIHDGKSGLEHAIHGAYDLVFLDINLPRLDGISLLQQMRATELGSARPVVILSNYCEPPLLVRGQELGVRRYLVKSEVTPAQLAANVHDWSRN
jgi:CheY-like chemotaxis protein